jgi:hypothetical protein
VDGVPEEQPFWERLMFGRLHRPSAEREGKTLRHVIHRLDDEAHLRDVLEEPYVRRNCTQEEMNEIIRNPELVPRTKPPTSGKR